MTRSSFGILEIGTARGGRDELPLFEPPLDPAGRPLIRLGRAKENDIILEAPNVSSQHAQLIWRQGGWLIQDLDSRNGTYLNGQRLSARQRYPVRFGDAIQIATAFTVRIRAAEGAEGSHGGLPLRDGDAISPPDRAKSCGLATLRAPEKPLSNG